MELPLLKLDYIPLKAIVTKVTVIVITTSPVLTMAITTVIIIVTTDYVVDLMLVVQEY